MNWHINENSGDTSWSGPCNRSGVHHTIQAAPEITPSTASCNEEEQELESRTIQKVQDGPGSRTASRQLQAVVVAHDVEIR